MRSCDNDFDEVWVEPVLADEIDCARVSNLERTLVLQPVIPTGMVTPDERLFRKATCTGFPFRLGI